VICHLLQDKMVLQSEKEKWTSELQLLIFSVQEIINLASNYTEESFSSLKTMRIEENFLGKVFSPIDHWKADNGCRYGV